MSVNEDWDVEQHKVEYESDEHWELRRKFLLAHKDKYSEDVLVCLAQVFVNVELLGCRYPQETMDLVKELSQDVAAEYREKQKKKLQRTFVEASEAASSKVKGCTAKTSTVTEEIISDKPNYKSNSPNHNLDKPDYKLKVSNNIPDTNNHTDQSCKRHLTWKEKRLEEKKKKLLSNVIKEPIANIDTQDHQSYETPNIEEIPSKRLKAETDDSLKDLENPYGNIILWERPGDAALNILEASAAISGVTLKWKYDKTEEGWECSFYIDSQKLGCSISLTKKIAKKLAAVDVLQKLQKHCYTVKVKQDLEVKTNVIVTTEEIKSQQPVPDDDWKESNCIGKKLMTMMGWSGGGLGKSEQGIMEPMSAMVKTQINREGLGLKANPYKTHEIKGKCRKLFKDLLQTDNHLQSNIVFLDFPKEDRMVIHQIARTMGLKSRSQGKDQRKLIVSRKVDIRSLVRDLNNLGGVTEKYELVKPTDEKSTSSPTSTNI
ncbi:uncharacterized protein LOC105429584 [Pogonomyrmex barbatus]|uniref:Uncharacterized protein LOC105429584 n=1 Tax=Pogonomyrmex barbatus TaxID=144034 RepID=A0A6I9WI70_9HYME|nr:uncharacterized protein LOC105429584 [Pogonomyrmex barbatus]